MDKAKKISLVIFDMDGLMFDTEKLSLIAWQEAGKNSGYEIPLDFIYKIIGVNSVTAESISRDYFGEDFPFSELRIKSMDFVSQYMDQNGVPLKTGLFELLEFLKQKSVLRAVATSTEREKAVKYLKLANVIDKFDLVVCGDEITKGKPEPEIFLTAAQKLGCIPEDCIVLEDSEYGIIAAARANMYPFFVPDLIKPNHEVLSHVHREFKTLLDVKEFLQT
ncbi:MAG: HAD family phosphatase [Bacillota bacterium]|nr:HAD family phosphatase [Bacillota bacterium]